MAPGDRRAGQRRRLREREARGARRPITGFGHRVYRAEDPRARHMREGVERLSQEMGQPQWYAILDALVQAMAPYARHGVNVNVDFYSGVIYYLHQIPKDLFVPIFAVGRVPGLDRAGAGAAGQQHPDPAAHALQRAGAARLRADGAARLMCARGHGQSRPRPSPGMRRSVNK